MSPSPASAEPSYSRAEPSRAELQPSCGRAEPSQAAAEPRCSYSSQQAWEQHIANRHPRDAVGPSHARKQAPTTADAAPCTRRSGAPRRRLASRWISRFWRRRGSRPSGRLGFPRRQAVRCRCIPTYSHPFPRPLTSMRLRKPQNPHPSHSSKLRLGPTALDGRTPPGPPASRLLASAPPGFAPPPAVPQASPYANRLQHAARRACPPMCMHTPDAAPSRQFCCSLSLAAPSRRPRRWAPVGRSCG